MHIKEWFYISSLSLVCLVSGCTEVKGKIENYVSHHNVYPEAHAINNQVSLSPPVVNIHHYKSVQNEFSRPYQRADLAIAVAASGGGYRASNLTMGVLMGLEKMHDARLNGNLLEEVDYFSSASGSGFAIGFYISQLRAYLQTVQDYTLYPHFSLSQTVQRLFLVKPTSVEQSVLDDENTLNENLNKVISFFQNNAVAYETAINNSVLYNAKHDLTLGDVFVSIDDKHREAKLPLWVANATIYQNMASFPFTPHVLAQYGVRRYQHLGKRYTLKGASTNPNYASQLPYSVALAASASYPLAFSSVTLGSDNCHGGCFLQLYDGGLTDNLGLASAFEMLNEDPAKIKVLIIIDASSKHESAYSKNETSPNGAALLWRILDSTVDTTHELESTHGAFIVKGLLCQQGASNVLVAYLKINRYPKASAIPTNLYLTSAQQQLLFKAGTDLVKHSAVLQKELPKLLAGDKQIGRCPNLALKNH